jgi:hypothetical protein
MNNHQIAYDYIQSQQVQECYTHKVHEAFKLLCEENQVFGLQDPVQKSYKKLVLDILGSDNMDWLEYWQFETDYGNQSREIIIDNQTYDSSTLTLFKYLDLTLT